MEADFIFDVSPVASVHASTLAEAPEGGLLAAWFGGSFEGHADVGIWLAEKRDRRRWSEPRLVADGVQADGQRFSCWNPVLHRSRDGALSLFYKVGPSPRRWWGMVARSHDAGRSWDPPERLSGRHPRPDQEQAGGDGGRHAHQPVQQRARRLARSPRVLPRRRPHLAGGKAAEQRPRLRRDPTLHPRLLRRLPAPVPQPPGRDHRVPLRRRLALVEDARDGLAQPGQRHRRRGPSPTAAASSSTTTQRASARRSTWR